MSASRRSRRLRRHALLALALAVLLLFLGDLWTRTNMGKLLRYTPPAESQYWRKPAVFRQRIANEGVDLAFVGTSRAHAGLSASHARDELMQRLGSDLQVFNYGLAHGQFHEVQQAIREIVFLSPGTVIVWGVSDVSFVAEPSLAPGFQWSVGELVDYLWRGDGSGPEKRRALRVYMESQVGKLWRTFGLRRQIRSYFAEYLDNTSWPKSLKSFGEPVGVRRRWERQNREIYGDNTGDAPTESSREKRGWTVYRWCEEQKLDISECLARRSPQPPSDWIGSYGWEELQETFSFVQEAGATLVLVEMPRPPVFLQSLDGVWLSAYRKLIAEAERRFEGEILRYGRGDKPLTDEYFADHSHLNSRGQELFTDWLVAELSAKGLFISRNKQGRP